MHPLSNVEHLVAKACFRGGDVLLVFNRPSQMFSEKSNPELLAALQQVVESAFGVTRETEYGVTDLRDHVAKADLLGIAYRGPTLLGFSSAKLYHENDLLYLHGTVVRAEFQTRGVGQWMSGEVFNFSRMTQLAFTTQNPVVYSLLRNTFGRVWPTHEEPVVPEHLRALGSELTARRSGVFDPTTFVSRGLYLEDLYRQIPVAADEAVDRWFQDSLRMQNRLTRDGFLFVATEQRQKVTT